MLGELRRKLERRQGERERVEKDLLEARETHQGFLRRGLRAERARVILQEVARQTQKELEYRINDLVTAALVAVFPDPYSFELEFVERRNKTEADLWLRRKGERMNPLDAAGGGAVDVAAFALRVALWGIRTPRFHSVLVLDEPFRFLSRELQPKASALLKILSERMGLQILMVSHSLDLIEEADRVFTVTRGKDGRSRVE